MSVTGRTRYIYTASSGCGSESHSRIGAFSLAGLLNLAVIVGYTEYRAPFTPSNGTIPCDVCEHVPCKWLKRVQSGLIGSMSMRHSRPSTRPDCRNRPARLSECSSSDEVKIRLHVRQPRNTMRLESGLIRESSPLQDIYLTRQSTVCVCGPHV